MDADKILKFFHACGYPHITKVEYYKSGYVCHVRDGEGPGFWASDRLEAMVLNWLNSRKRVITYNGKDGFFLSDFEANRAVSNCDDLTDAVVELAIMIHESKLVANG